MLSQKLISVCRKLGNAASLMTQKRCIQEQASQISKLDKNTLAASNCIEFKNKWPDQEKDAFVKDMQIYPDFLTPDQEKSLLEEVENYLKRLHYEFDHWDDAIHGYRETERKHWYPHNKELLQKISDLAFQGQMMPYIHVLDLADDGVIKPHVDSTRYCGSTIAGLSLLSDCVMRLVRIDEKQYEQDAENSRRLDNLRKFDYHADVLLKRRSLYVMTNTARYNFTHEVLANEFSFFQEKKIPKTRRISIVCRNEP